MHCIVSVMLVTIIALFCLLLHALLELYYIIGCIVIDVMYLVMSDGSRVECLKMNTVTIISCQLHGVPGFLAGASRPLSVSICYFFPPELGPQSSPRRCHGAGAPSMLALLPLSDDIGKRLEACAERHPSSNCGRLPTW